MTPFETEALAALREIVRVFGQRKIGLTEFRETLGLAVKTMKRLENVFYGCPTGVHLTSCTCKPEERGHPRYFYPKKSNDQGLHTG